MRIFIHYTKLMGKTLLEEDPWLGGCYTLVDVSQNDGKVNYNAFIGTKAPSVNGDNWVIRTDVSRKNDEGSYVTQVERKLVFDSEESARKAHEGILEILKIAKSIEDARTELMQRGFL